MRFAPWLAMLALAPVPLACTLDASGTAPAGGTSSATGGSGGSGGATTGGGMGGAGGGVAGGGGAGGSVVEDCTNGVDDDQNGQTDCEEPQCLPLFTCVESAFNPVFVVEGGGACALPLVNLALSDCGACPCAPVPGICQATGSFFSDSSCATEISGSAFNTITCTNKGGTGSGVNVHVTATATTGMAGSCPMPTEPSLAACQVEAATTCTTGNDVCAPADLGAHCVVVEGDTCPASHPEGRVVRLPPETCGCTCALEAGTETCPNEITVFDQDGCMAGGVSQTIGLGGQSCKNTGLITVDSVQAPQAIPTCLLGSTPTGSDTMLCCEMP